MFKKNIIISALIFFALILTNCSDEPSSVGVGLVEKDLVNFATLDSFSDSTEQKTASFVKRLQLGSSQMLLIGKNFSNEASSLIKFYISLSEKISADLDSIEILSSKIILTPYYSIGDTTKPFGFTTHRLTSDWAFATFTYDSLSKVTYESNDVGNNYKKDSVYSFDIDKNLVSAWLKNAKKEETGANYGIYLKPKTDTDFFRGFYGYSSILSLDVQPKLNIIVKKNGSYIDTLNFYTLADVHVVSGDDLLLPKKYIAVQSGVSVNSVFWFDISSLPADAVVNKAELILSYDSTYSMFGTSYLDGLVAYYMTDSTKLEYSSEGAVVLTKKSGTYEGNIVNIVNRMLKEKKNNGIVVSTRQPIDGLELFAIHNRESDDPVKKPRLILHYTFMKKN